MKNITKYAKENRLKKTLAEKRLFVLLRQQKIKFRTQRMFDFYIVDFLIPNKWLIVEMDGKYHNNQKEYDNKRDDYLKNKGFNILRFKNEDVFTNPLFIINSILNIKDKPAPKNYQDLYGTSKY